MLRLDIAFVFLFLFLYVSGSCLLPTGTNTTKHKGKENNRKTKDKKGRGRQTNPLIPGNKKFRIVFVSGRRPSLVFMFLVFGSPLDPTVRYQKPTVKTKDNFL